MKGLRETVLVVANDDSTRQTLEDVLTASGFRVLATKTAAEARRHIAQDAPDVVVLDSSLVSGIGVLATLRATAALKKVPVLAVTSANAGAMALRAFGSVTVVQKPLTADALVPVVQELLARKAF